jgi:hypothetical protein
MGLLFPETEWDKRPIPTPTYPSPNLPESKKMPKGSGLITGTSPATSSFRLWATTNPSQPFATWTLLTNSVFASDGAFSFTDSAAANLPARFYRVSMP